MKKHIVLLFTLLSASICFAQKISLDPTFGEAGAVMFKNIYSQIFTIKPLLGKKVIVQGGFYVSENKYRSVLYKIDHDGKLDSTFSGNGILQDSILEPLFSHVFVQPDGRIYTAGQGFISNYIACYNSNGEKLTTFGQSGTLIIDSIPNTQRIYIKGFSPCQDNSFIVGFTGYLSKAGVTSYGYILAKYDSTGCMDKRFGDEGIVTFSFSKTKFSLEKVIVLKDGSIVCTGSDHSNYENNSMCLLKLHPDGTYDSSFGTNGKVICDVDTEGGEDMFFNPYEEKASDVIELDDHRLLVSVICGKQNRDCVLRFLPDGNLDTTFGKNGLSPAFDNIKGFTTLKDGRILINVNLVTCLSPNGMLDSTLAIDPSLTLLDCLVAQENGTVWAGTYTKDSTGKYIPSLVRYTFDADASIHERTVHKSLVTVFPTIFNNAISFQSEREKIQNISIYDLHGKCFITKTVNDWTTTINTHLPKGLYLCKIETTNGVVFQKVVSEGVGK